jgi:transposase-like protein
MCASPSAKAGGSARGRDQGGRLGRRRRLAGAPGRGTLEKDKPPILGVIQRGGQVMLHMLANVQQATIQPVIEATVAKGSLIYTDEYNVYTRLSAWGYHRPFGLGGGNRSSCPKAGLPGHRQQCRPMPQSSRSWKSAVRLDWGCAETGPIVKGPMERNRLGSGSPCGRRRRRPLPRGKCYRLVVP